MQVPIPELAVAALEIGPRHDAQVATGGEATALGLGPRRLRDDQHQRANGVDQGNPSATIVEVFHRLIVRRRSKTSNPARHGIAPSVHNVSAS